MPKGNDSSHIQLRIGSQEVNSVAVERVTSSRMNDAKKEVEEKKKKLLDIWSLIHLLAALLIFVYRMSHNRICNLCRSI